MSKAIFANVTGPSLALASALLIPSFGAADTILFPAICSGANVRQGTVEHKLTDREAKPINCDAVGLTINPDGRGAALQLLKLQAENAGDPQVTFVGDSSVDAHTKLITISVKRVYERISSDWPPVIDAEGSCYFSGAATVSQLKCGVSGRWWGHQREYDIFAHLKPGQLLPKIQGNHAD